MANYSSFDIIGPVMVGPSSSHTAGACRLGRLAKALSATPKKVDIILHGSFAKTYKGHGTDLALLAGLLGMDTDDERIRFAEKYHANTAKFRIENEDGDVFTMIGSSLGGGRVMITEINGFPVEVSGDLPAISNIHLNRPGAIYTISGVLAKHNINVYSMKVYRSEKKSTNAFMILETDEIVPPEVMAEIEELPVIVDVKFIPPIV